MKKLIFLFLFSFILAYQTTAQDVNVIEAIQFKPVMVPEGVPTIFYPVGGYSFNLLINGVSVEQSDNIKPMLSLTQNEVRSSVTKLFGSGVPVACAAQITFTDTGYYEIEFDFNVQRGNAINVDKVGRIAPLSGSKRFYVHVDYPEMALSYKDTIGSYIIGERDSLNFYTKGFDQTVEYSYLITNEGGQVLDRGANSYVNISQFLTPENIGVNRIELSYKGKPFMYYNPETGDVKNSTWYYIVNVPRDYLVETDWGISESNPLLLTTAQLRSQKFRTFNVYYEFGTRRLPAEFRGEANFEVYVNGRRSDMFFTSLQALTDLKIENNTQAIFIPLRLDGDDISKLKAGDEIRLDISYVDIYDNVISSSYFAKITNN